MRIIAGSPRSGTTHALRVFLWGEDEEQLEPGSRFNEPVRLTNLVGTHKVGAAVAEVGRLAATQQVVKSPVVGLIFPDLDPVHEVALTFRDVRLVIASVYRHHAGVRNVIGQERPFWASYANKALPDHPFERVCQMWETVYSHAVKYRGPMSVLSYGFWHEWPQIGSCGWKVGGHMRDEILKEVTDDMRFGLPYSSASFRVENWHEFCRQHRITPRHVGMAERLNEKIGELFAANGYKCKTLDDWAEESFTNEQLVDLVGTETAVSCDRLEWLRRMCVRASSIGGEVAEVGVWKGGDDEYDREAVAPKDRLRFRFL